MKAALKCSIVGVQYQRFMLPHPPKLYPLQRIPVLFTYLYRMFHPWIIYIYIYIYIYIFPQLVGLPITVSNTNTFLQFMISQVVTIQCWQMAWRSNWINFSKWNRGSHTARFAVSRPWIQIPMLYQSTPNKDSDSDHADVRRLVTQGQMFQTPSAPRLSNPALNPCQNCLWLWHISSINECVSTYHFPWQRVPDVIVDESSQ